MLSAKAQGALRLRTVSACAKAASADKSLEERSRLQSVNGISAGRQTLPHQEGKSSLGNGRLDSLLITTF